jgi:hypothetical protein
MQTTFVQQFSTTDIITIAIIGTAGGVMGIVTATGGKDHGRSARAAKVLFVDS